MKIPALFFVLASLTSFAQAQPDSLERKQNRPTYFNYFQSGALIGKKGYGTTASFSTVHGVRYKRLAMGLGVGYDDYTRSATGDVYTYENFVHWKAVPFFAALSFDFLKNRKSDFFLQLNAGYSKIMAQKREQFNFASDVKGGIMISPTVGYRISSGVHRLYVGAGYKWQVNKYDYNAFPWHWGYPAGEINVKETMQRMVVHIGFGWN